MKDKQVFDLIKLEYERQKNGLELIASENYVSEQVLKAMGSCLTNKYAEGYPGKRYYGGCEIVDQTEQLAIDRVCKLFGAEYANVQPHSGAQANAAVFFALLNPSDTFMGLDLSHGGHLTHGSPVNLSGILYNSVAYHLNKRTGLIDYEEMEELAYKYQPRFIMAGASAFSRDWNYERMRQIADGIGALLVADIAHPAGLIAKKLLNDPMPYCHIVTSTTHKTLRGPRGGIILMKKDFTNPMGITNKKGKFKKMSEVLNSAVFPGQQGGPLQHVIASKAVAFGEALKEEFQFYSKQVIKNSKLMADLFINNGYKVVSGGTDNHCMLIDLRNKFPNISGKIAEKTLEKAGITINKNMVPFDNRSPFQTSGIRIGTPAITTRGCTEKDIPQIVEFMDTVLSNISNDKKIHDIKLEVNKLMKDKPLFVFTKE